MVFVFLFRVRVRVMVFSATFNNISVLSWQLVVLVEETGVPGENHRTVAFVFKFRIRKFIYLTIIIL